MLGEMLQWRFSPQKSPQTSKIEATPLLSLSTPLHHSGIGGSVRRAYDGLLLDAGGTLLLLAKPVEKTYASLGAKYGLAATPAEIKQGFKRAFASPSWPENFRYPLFCVYCQGDGWPFWKLVVSEATGCSDIDYFLRSL